jgi:hypothetical protein
VTLIASLLLEHRVVALLNTEGAHSVSVTQRDANKHEEGLGGCFSVPGNVITWSAASQRYASCLFSSSGVCYGARKLGTHICEFV